MLPILFGMKRSEVLKMNFGFEYTRIKIHNSNQQSLWMNLWKLKWDLMDPYIQSFSKYGFLLTLLIVHYTLELVN